MDKINSADYGLRNYLNKHNIYKDNYDMHTVIINSFYNEQGGDNNKVWKEKVKYVNEHFGLFAQYANNNWKNL